jgi:hypothetical protein
MSQNLELGRSKRAGVGCKKEISALDPVDTAEAGDEVATLDHDPIEMEIAKAGVAGT